MAIFKYDLSFYTGHKLAAFEDIMVTADTPEDADKVADTYLDRSWPGWKDDGQKKDDRDCHWERQEVDHAADHDKVFYLDDEGEFHLTTVGELQPSAGLAF
jgi:hypothetical protein